MDDPQRRWLVGLAGLAAVWAAGCNSNRTSATPQQLRPLVPSYVPEIPLPMGFQKDPARSDDYATGRRRLLLRHTYVGEGDLDSVRKFYQDYMPLNGWTKNRDVDEFGDVRMFFERQGETAEVQVRERSSGFGKKIEVRVIVMPTEPGPGIEAPKKELVP